MFFLSGSLLFRLVHKNVSLLLFVIVILFRDIFSHEHVTQNTPFYNMYIGGYCRVEQRCCDAVPLILSKGRIRPTVLTVGASCRLFALLNTSPLNWVLFGDFRCRMKS